MFPLICKSQNYAWGKQGEQSVVGQIHRKQNPSQSKAEMEKPFAELWMGAHPNGPSMVEINPSDPILRQLIANDEFLEKHAGETLPINAVCSANATGLLGEKYTQEFGSESLVYLFKVLSVRTALSIQAHPN